ncbi:MAG: hypothetical protein JEY71_10645 [Sphaerochaeta sp.]|nr:hypothetical protein [Sphaerochaeta sp.]
MVRFLQVESQHGRIGTTTALQELLVASRPSSVMTLDRPASKIASSTIAWTAKSGERRIEVGTMRFTTPITSRVRQ